jgi:hypothetical protein
MDTTTRHFGPITAIIDHQSYTVILVRRPAKQPGGVSLKKCKAWAIKSLMKDYRGYAIVDGVDGHNLRNGDNLPEMREISREH